MTGIRVTADPDPGSFRDPAGQVWRVDSRILRTVAPDAWADVSALRETGRLDRLVAEGRLIGTFTPAPDTLPQGFAAGGADTGRLLEHDRVPFVSYPYEWPFALLKRAALLHLDLHLDLLRDGFTLSDASAYNVQFRGPAPVFIDVLSIRRYRPGAYWAGYRQFCEQFLNPLLLHAYTGVPCAPWYRGTLEGIPLDTTARLLPARARLSWRAWLHVFLHARSSRTDAGTTAAATATAGRPLSLEALTWMLLGLRRWIASLTPRGVGPTIWRDYADHTSYSADEAHAKQAFVARHVERHHPGTVLDLGCNTGDYSEAALAAGATRVVGLDADWGALDRAGSRADARGLDFLPLHGDALNPSPSQGWRQAERAGLLERAAGVDSVLALALAHHLAIGRNVPLPQVIAWLVSLAPAGVIEFVPKSDTMVQRMLAHREDIFPSYSIDVCRAALQQHATIVREVVVSASGRTLLEFERP